VQLALFALASQSQSQWAKVPFIVEREKGHEIDGTTRLTVQINEGRVA